MKGFNFISRRLAVMKKAHSRTQQAVNKTAVQLVGQAKRNATGRPGPKVQTGLLRNSIIPILAEGISETARVEVRAPYAAHVEFGTRKMPEYPFFRPAILWVRKFHEQRIRNL